MIGIQKIVYLNVLRSRTRIPDPEDTEAGVNFLKSICYPYMNRFIDANQDMGKVISDNY